MIQIVNSLALDDLPAIVEKVYSNDSGAKQIAILLFSLSYGSPTRGHAFVEDTNGFKFIWKNTDGQHEIVASSPRELGEKILSELNGEQSHSVQILTM